jgi:hypothetical protein
MLVQSQLSLVLSGVSVLRGGKTVDGRLGCGYLAGSRTPGFPFPIRASRTEPDAHDMQADPPHAGNPPANRAGRSVRSAGTLFRRTPTTTVGGTTPCAWSRARGAKSQSAAIPAMQKRIAALASVGEAFPNGLPVRKGHSPLTASVRRDWAKPSGRIPPASTWGQGS